MLLLVTVPAAAAAECMFGWHSCYCYCCCWGKHFRLRCCWCCCSWYWCCSSCRNEGCQQVSTLWSNCGLRSARCYGTSSRNTEKSPQTNKAGVDENGDETAKTKQSVGCPLVCSSLVRRQRTTGKEGREGRGSRATGSSLVNGSQMSETTAMVVLLMVMLVRLLGVVVGDVCDNIADGPVQVLFVWMKECVCGTARLSDTVVFLW